MLILAFLSVPSLQFPPFISLPGRGYSLLPVRAESLFNFARQETISFLGLQDAFLSGIA